LKGKQKVEKHSEMINNYNAPEQEQEVYAYKREAKLEHLQTEGIMT